MPSGGPNSELLSGGGGVESGGPGCVGALSVALCFWGVVVHVTVSFTEHKSTFLFLLLTCLLRGTHIKLGGTRRVVLPGALSLNFL